MFVRFGLVFFVLFLSITVNLPEGMLASLGFHPTYLLGTLVAVAITGLVFQRRLALIVLVILTTIGANLPPEVAAHFGVDRDILTAALAAIVLAPLALRFFE